jgi:hypothetical protein
LRKVEYVPLWYFTQKACRTADKDRDPNEELWDITKTSDNRFAFRTATSNRPSANALSDEDLTWEQFMDANHLLLRWLIPQGWPPDYAKVLSTFFWKIENHEELALDGGKDTLLLYQARQRRAWHDDLKADHFFNLSNITEKKMGPIRREADSQRYAAHRQTVRIPPFVLLHIANEPLPYPTINTLFPYCLLVALLLA